MLHGNAPLCDISSWCNRVIDHEYLSGCDVYLTRDVVLNCLCAIALLSATFAQSCLAWKRFTGALHPSWELPCFPSPCAIFLPLFSLEVFRAGPFAFLGVASFLSEVFEQIPLHFLGLPLFSLKVFERGPLHVLGLPLFPSEVFERAPFHFLWLPLFSSEVFK
jgi:hypothetical protein